METGVVLFLADGFEEVEAVTSIDYIRRAGIKLVSVGVGNIILEGSHGLKIHADITEESFDREFRESCDAVILPGGMNGAENLARSGLVRRACCEAMQRGVLVAAICAAPVIALDRFGILEGRQYTCYPGFEAQVRSGNAHFVESRVCRDGNLITSRGAGTAAEFALAIISCLRSPEEARRIEQDTLVLVKH